LFLSKFDNKTGRRNRARGLKLEGLLNSFLQNYKNGFIIYLEKRESPRLVFFQILLREFYTSIKEGILCLSIKKNQNNVLSIFFKKNNKLKVRF
jgi:hypothetical protein